MSVSVANSSFDRALQILHLACDFQLGAFAEFPGDLTSYYPSLLMEPISEAIVWENSLRFSARTFIRMKTRIMQILVASGEPTTGQRQETGIFL